MRKTVTSFEAITTDWYARNGYNQIYERSAAAALHGPGNASTSASALNHSVVWACNRIIAETVGFIPLVMLPGRQEPGEGQATRHEASHVLRRFNAPNDDMTAMGFRETLTSHCVLQGNAYAQIIRRSGTGVAMELQPLQPSQVRSGRDRASQLVYVVKTGNEQEKTFTVQKNKPQDIFHMRGLGNNGTVGFSVISMAHQSIGTAIATREEPRKLLRPRGPAPVHPRDGAEVQDRKRTSTGSGPTGKRYTRSRTKRRSSKTTSSTSRSA